MSRISVIIPTHHRPHLLIRAIESARAAATDVEIIVVDDASTDNTAEVCGELAGINYVRVERNQGVAGARNIGIFESSAPYIAFLDDDDLRVPGSLDLQADVLDRNPGAGFVCGAMIMADQDYRPTGDVIRPRHISGDAFWSLLELDFPVMPLCALIRKESLLQVGLLDRNISSIDDWDIFTRIAELYPVMTIQEAVGIYRQPTPSSDQGSSARAAQLHLATRHQLKLLRLPRVAAVPLKERRLIRKRTINRVCNHLIWNAGKNHLPAGELRPAFANIAVALKLDPLIPFRRRGYQKVVRKLSEKFRGF